MMKYNKGDKFIVEIDEIFKNSEDDIIHKEKLYRIKGFRNFVFDDNGLDKLEKLNVIKDKMVRKCVADNYRDEAFKVAYNKGLEDAWKCARKIFTTDCATLQKVLGSSDEGTIIMLNEPQAILEKLEVYEKEQAEIKVGDVVTIIGKTVVVTRVSEDKTKVDGFGIGGFAMIYKYDDCKKTGKHIDIQSVLKQIGDVENLVF